MISFIIPAHDEEDLIGDTIDAIVQAAQALEESHEIIVANDASTDRTAEVARAHGARVLSVNKRQIAAVRNAGAREARGRHFFFVDADTLVSPATVACALAALDEGAVGGGSTMVFEGRLPWGASLVLRWGGRLMQMARLASGCFLFSTRDAFETAGGFDEKRYAGEELFLSRKLKRLGRFVVVNEPVVTSSRKLRTHSYRELLGTMFLPLVKGPRAFQDPTGLDVWYGKRRPDPARDLAPGRSQRDVGSAHRD